MALLPIANSMLQKIARFCELAANQQQQQNLLCLTPGEEVDDDSNSNKSEEDQEQQSSNCRHPAEGTWIKTSMEKIEHFLEAQKYSNYISHPVHLAEYANNMIVEHMMMSTQVKDIANGLKQQYAENDEEVDLDDIPLLQRLKISQMKGRLPGEPSPQSSTLIPGLKAFGRGSRGDTFFNGAPCSSNPIPTTAHDDESSKPQGRRSRRGKKRTRSTQQPFNPNVRDYFDDPFPSSKSGQKGVSDFSGGEKSRSNRNSKLTDLNESHQSEIIVEPHGLGNFVQYTSDTIRVADRKYQMQDDAVNGFLNERKNTQVMDYFLRKPNLLDKSREFLIEATVYAQTPEEDIGGLDICSSIGSYKIEILGSKTLADMRDALMCDNDFTFLKELQHPDEVQDMSELAKNKISSAMLLIDNTIYNDTRWPNNFNYASQVIHWTGQQPSKKSGPFKRGDMSTTKVEDLTIQFGFPYLFRHLGDCEHVIVFNKARLLTLEDEHRLFHFPRISWISDIRPQLCRIDNEFIATWAVLDYDNFPESPMLICTSCLKGFCYNKFGDKRGQFRLFPYRQLICEIPLLSEKVPKKSTVLTST